MFKIILNEARAKQNLAEPSIESNGKYELGDELLKELRCNSYNGRVEKDVVRHIAKILDILDPIEVAEAGNNEGIMDKDVSSDDDRDHTNSSTITKPELKIGDEFLKIFHDNSFNDTPYGVSNPSVYGVWICLDVISLKRDTAYQRQLFTRKRELSIPNMAYHSSSIRCIQLDNYAEI
nr:hypothetical protein [Tanacetum cinerariifolium]